MSHPAKIHISKKNNQKKTQNKTIPGIEMRTELFQNSHEKYVQNMVRLYKFERCSQKNEANKDP